MSSQESKSSAGIAWLDNNFTTYDEIQKRIHSFAELGYQETKSSAELASHLEANGFTVEWGVAGIPTAFIATYGEGSPVIGLLGEYDALKGLSQETVPYKCPVVPDGNGHGCGHNLIGTATKCIMTVAKAFYWSALELFTTPEELKAVRAEFESVRGQNPVFDKLMDRLPPLDYCK